VAVRVEATPAGRGVFVYAEKFHVAAQAAQRVSIGEGKESAVRVILHEKGVTVPYADRLAIAVTTQSTMGATPAPRTPPATPPNPPQDRAAPLSTDELTRAIMGGEPPPLFAPPALADDAEVMLAVKGLTLGRVLDGVDLEVRAGEIVGVAGVEGNGQRELVRALAGLEPRATGAVTVAGRDLAGARVRARRPFLGVVHEDRHAEGLLLDASVGDNLVLGDLGDPGALDERATVSRRIEAFGVVPPDPARLAGELSGGNQQKIVIARALDRLGKAGAWPTRGTPPPPRAAAVLAQPTRGVDVGAAAVIHRAIGAAAEAGIAVLVISADLAELRRLSHRIVVMRRGRIVKSLSRDASETEIGRAMLGVEAA